MKFILYTIAMMVLLGIGTGAYLSMSHERNEQCLLDTRNIEDGLRFARAMARCVQKGFSVPSSPRAASLLEAIDAAPEINPELVGQWRGEQKGCAYKHTFKSSGQFISEPIQCYISDKTFTGKWTLHKNLLVWFTDGQQQWPPDTNVLDQVEDDFFLLTEIDGKRTRFTRIPNTHSPEDGRTAAPLEESEETKQGHRWAEENDIRQHAACKTQFAATALTAARRGCHRYVSETTVLPKLAPPREDTRYDQGTRADCIKAAESYWDAVIADLQEQEDDAKADQVKQNERRFALSRCNYFAD